MFKIFFEHSSFPEKCLLYKTKSNCEHRLDRNLKTLRLALIIVYEETKSKSNELRQSYLTIIIDILRATVGTSLSHTHALTFIPSFPARSGKILKLCTRARRAYTSFRKLGLYIIVYYIRPSAAYVCSTINQAQMLIERFDRVYTAFHATPLIQYVSVCILYYGYVCAPNVNNLFVLFAICAVYVNAIRYGGRRCRHRDRVYFRFFLIKCHPSAYGTCVIISRV